MQPFYFGTEEMPLFGVYHPPLTRADRETGVVLCSPFGSEYIQSHRALRQLAIRLSHVGFHVLRFDYYGSGDSGGKSDEADVERWKKDISIAIEKLKDSAGLSKVSLMGLRLGSSLATIAAAKRSDVESLLLWEPVINGKSYIQELMLHQESWLRMQLFSELRMPSLKTGTPEIIGFPLTDRLRQDIEAINLLSLDRCTAKHVLIIRSSRGVDDQSLLKSMKELGASPDYLQVPVEGLWLKREGIAHVVVPNEALEAITVWMAENHK